uniref:Ankyrin repeat and SOCS box protein 3 n=1 Tax=Lygus hesperus TaxID=30085 RepID=A0A0K8SKZ7_LYGHE
MNDGVRIVGINFEWHNPHTSSKMARAVRAKNITEVKRLLKQGVSPDIPDNRGYTTLHEASRSDDTLEILRVLTSSGAYIEHKTVDGETPLFVACSNSSEKIVEFFLKCSCLVNNANIDSVTPLHIACSKRNYNIIKMLIKAGANLNAKDNDQFTPLFYAIQFENPTAVKVLLEAGCDPETRDFFSRSPLQFSCMVGNLEIFDILIEHLGLSKKLVNQQTLDGWTLLMEAVQFKNYNIAEKLISYGADTSLVDSRGMLALHLAAHCNRTDCLELIIRHTPKDVIERYATAKETLTHTRSLPVLLIDKNMFDGLKLLFEYGVSDEVLSCPAKMGDNLVSPVSFLLLHGNNIDQNEKGKYLELFLSKEALKDPIYNDSNVSVTRSVDAAIRSHRIDHKNCNCEQLLTMLLNEGVDPDVPLCFRIPQPRTKIPQPFINAMDNCFIRGLCLLLAHSNSVEPEDLLTYFIERLFHPNYGWNEKEEDLLKFLVWTSTDFKAAYPLFTELATSAPANILPKILPLHEMVKTKALKVQSLKHLSRLSIRRQVCTASMWHDTKEFRRALKSLTLPRALIDFLSYHELLSYTN